MPSASSRSNPSGSLLSVLRSELGLTGAKPGCGEGVRGATLGARDDERWPEEPGATTPELPAPGRRPWDLLAPEERDYFDVLSDGMVVVLSAEQTAGGGWSTTSGAWIHVGANGIVTAFTGEVDVGQDRRVEVVRVVTAFECGAIVNPDGLRNQIEGATVMGLGGALSKPR